MFNAIAKLFAADAQSASLGIEPKLAVAALMVHLSAVDGVVDEVERVALTKLLSTHFELAPAEVTKLIEMANDHDREAVDFYKFTTVITQMTLEERRQIIRMMWEMVYADDKSHEMEENMIWRVAELIGVSTRERNQLRKDVRDNK
jgi:uncharacterized tellurite resistance protein B-like protein